MLSPLASDCGKSTRLIGKAKASANSVPLTTPSKGPGKRPRRAGLNRFQAMMVAMVTSPAIAARWCTEPSTGTAFTTASGIAARLASPLARGASSSIT